jgi:hypothetical protein
MKIGLLALLLALTSGRCSAAELKAAWCDFSARVSGDFAFVTDDPEAGILNAQQIFPTYGLILTCERRPHTPLPDEQRLCLYQRYYAELLKGTKFVSCGIRLDPAKRFIVATIVSENGDKKDVDVSWVAPQSKFTLGIVNIGLSDDELVALSSQLSAAVSFVGSN